MNARTEKIFAKKELPVKTFHLLAETWKQGPLMVLAASIFVARAVKHRCSLLILILN